MPSSGIRENKKAAYWEGMVVNMEDTKQKNTPLVIKKPIEEKSLSTPEDFTDQKALYDKLIQTIHGYRPGTDISMVEKAYYMASRFHEGQKRKSGEPYIIHPLCVAIILA